MTVISIKVLLLIDNKILIYFNILFRPKIVVIISIKIRIKFLF